MMIAFVAQSAAEQAHAAASMTTSLIVLGLVVLLIIAMWKVFERAGEPGWAALVPIYNLYILTRVAQISGWWILAAFIPLVNILFCFTTSINVAKRFNRGTLFGVGVALLPFIFYPMLAWGDESPTPRLA
jgi:F0F1-type ATP synthase membrane subunit a